MSSHDHVPIGSRSITPALIDLLKAKFLLDWNGIHGVTHWARVRTNGLVLAERNGANPRIIEYFAFLHDVCRRSDGKDPDHGSRAALFARYIRDQYLDLNNTEFSILTAALGGHTHGQYHEDITVISCWDADRLDLARVGIEPDPARLCTADARKTSIIDCACQNSRTWLKAWLESLPPTI